MSRQKRMAVAVKSEPEVLKIKDQVVNFDPIDLLPDKQVGPKTTPNPKTPKERLMEFAQGKWFAAGQDESFESRPHSTDYHGINSAPACKNCDVTLPRFVDLMDK